MWSHIPRRKKAKCLPIFKTKLGRTRIKNIQKEQFVNVALMQQLQHSLTCLTLKKHIYTFNLCQLVKCSSETRVSFCSEVVKVCSKTKEGWNKRGRKGHIETVPVNSKLFEILQGVTQVVKVQGVKCANTSTSRPSEIFSSRSWLTSAVFQRKLAQATASNWFLHRQWAYSDCAAACKCFTGNSWVETGWRQSRALWSKPGGSVWGVPLRCGAVCVLIQQN